MMMQSPQERMTCFCSEPSVQYGMHANSSSDRCQFKRRAFAALIAGQSTSIEGQGERGLELLEFEAGAAERGGAIYFMLAVCRAFLMQQNSET